MAHANEYDRPAGPFHPISLDARYLGAWAEVNARMQSRYNILAIHLGSATGILGFLYNISEKISRAVAERKTPSQESDQYWYLAVGIPILSVITALLLFSHNNSIRRLNKVMMQMEVFRSPDWPEFNCHGYDLGYKKISSKNAEIFGITIVFLVALVFPYVLFTSFNDPAMSIRHVYSLSYFGCYWFLGLLSLVLIWGPERSWYKFVQSSIKKRAAQLAIVKQFALRISRGDRTTPPN